MLDEHFFVIGHWSGLHDSGTKFYRLVAMKVARAGEAPAYLVVQHWGPLNQWGRSKSVIFHSKEQAIAHFSQIQRSKMGRGYRDWFGRHDQPNCDRVLARLRSTGEKCALKDLHTLLCQVFGINAADEIMSKLVSAPSSLADGGDRVDIDAQHEAKRQEFYGDVWGCF